MTAQMNEFTINNFDSLYYDHYYAKMANKLGFPELHLLYLR
jgi:uncharacterized protein YdiU (UPF0061 family)